LIGSRAFAGDVRTFGKKLSVPPVDICPMVDAQDDHGPLVIVDLVDHAVRATTSRPQPDELSLERVSNPTRGTYERPRHELDDRTGNTFRQPSQ
jgi:hypothetical protein